MSKIAAWFEERLGISAVVRFGAQKQVPLHKHTIWSYTGSAILVFFGIQVATGILLAFYYRPTLEAANASLERIMTEISFGWIVRSIHSWSATFMIITVFVHLVSVALTKAYRKPRELTWMTGALLLAVSLFFGFTGYLLPWDELSLAATKVGTDIPKAVPVVGEWATKFLRGGDDVTGDTLSRFFILHVTVLPLVLLLLLAVHVYLIQKLGMSLPLESEIRGEKAPGMSFWPNFVAREAAVWLVLLGLLITVAVLFAPSLGPPADLMAPAPEGVKPEWYFLFLFQTLKLFPAKVGFVSGETIAVLLIGLGALALFLLPLIDNRPETRKGKIVAAAFLAFLAYALGMSVWSLL
ncbi:MAG: cytochrome bc complex cytochrome b subunit [Candidatus Aminicenantes bacterium]|nr:cytochrome bc complex cytochrome b subunit [Candidatus Aminicenantes bacterium]